MIELKVEDYCANCPTFTPVAETYELDRYSPELCKFITHCDTVVTCEHKKRCAVQYDYLKTQK